MSAHRGIKWLLIAVMAIAVLGAIGVGAMHLAARSLKESILQLLGPESEVAGVRVGLTHVVISDIRVTAPKGWPAKTALSADEVVIVPDLGQLISREIHVTRVEVKNAYIAGVRPKEGGGLKVLPGILGREKTEKSEGRSRTATIDTVRLDNCVVELFDATLTGHQKVRIDGVQGSVDDLHVPDLDVPLKVDLQGVIKGPNHQGTISVNGWVDSAGKSSVVTTRVRNVDLAKFEPYLIQKTKAGIDRGTFNLDLKATVRNNVLTAPGTLTLTGLKLKTDQGAFSNIPRRAVIGAMADENDEITLHFDLEGNLDNPSFSLSEKLGLKTGAAILKGLGLGFEALIRAFFIIVNGFGSALGGAAR